MSGSTKANTSYRTRPTPHGRGLSLLSTLLLVALPAVSPASERHATMMIGATVQGVTRIVDAGAPGRLVVTERDVAAGFVDVHPASPLRITTNSPQGVSIEIRPRQLAFAEVEVGYGGGVARLKGDALRLVQRGQRAATLELSYRFRLPAGLPAGSYDWPLEVVATPL